MALVFCSNAGGVAAIRSRRLVQQTIFVFSAALCSRLRSSQQPLREYVDARVVLQRCRHLEWLQFVGVDRPTVDRRFHHTHHTPPNSTVRWQSTLWSDHMFSRKLAWHFREEWFFFLHKSSLSNVRYNSSRYWSACNTFRTNPGCRT